MSPTRSRPAFDQSPATPWLDQVLGAVNARLADMQQALRGPLQAFESFWIEHHEEIRGALQSVAELAERYQNTLPPNWRDLETDDFAAVLELVEAGTINVVWAPRTDMLREFIAADAHVRSEQILVKRRHEILDDIESLLDTSTAIAVDDQRELASKVREGLDAARDGHDRAAQALAASALGFLLHHMLGFATLASARKAFQRSTDDATMVELRLVALQLATAHALINTDDHPDGFNRHGTQHGDPDYFSPAHMLGGLLLMAGWVRELSWLADNAPQVFEPPTQDSNDDGYGSDLSA